MDVYILIIIIIGMAIVNIPIAFSIGIPSFLYLWLFMDLPLMTIVVRFINSINDFTLLAVPFFILVGNLMNTSGITDRIFNFAGTLVGHLSGGLAYANIIASIIFSGMSGAALADAAGLGTVEIKAMTDEGYEAGFATAITAASSIIGPIIPPSIPIVIYGVIAEVSIGRLFIAGIVPGFMMGAVLFIMTFYYSKKRNYPKQKRSSLNEIFKSFISSFPALFTIVIILGGIFTGIFTPTEAAAAGVVYVLFIGGIVYRTFTFKILKDVFFRSLQTTSIVMLIVGGAALFSAVLTRQQIPLTLANFFLANVDSPLIFLFLVNIFLLIIGCFLETIAAINILVPVLLPIAFSMGIDPVHFGIIMVLNLMIGLLTPPFGMILYVLTDIAEIPFEKVMKNTLPFLVPLIIVLLLVTYLPNLTLFLATFIF